MEDSIVGDFDAEDLFVATASSSRIWWVFDDLDLTIVEGRFASDSTLSYLLNQILTFIHKVLQFS
ncbi:hypothetical protein MUK42_37565 [Musa troglodytarum]|uniref:Uncharacterized protein n=1 Tax=Musa troglodytarum TaxID=320322 RepID=A0A9E7K0M2_9LILI|nr:hypothetical protein MUK42_37565 [Musa troglodytarum]